MKNNEKLGKVLIGVGFVLIGIPLVVVILYALRNFGFFRGIDKLLYPPNIFSRWLGGLEYYFQRGDIFGTSTFWRETPFLWQSSRFYFLRTPGVLFIPNGLFILWNFLFLFLPNVLIVSGFSVLINQNQKIEIKKSFNKIVIIGLAINILVLFKFFNLFDLLYRPVMMNLSFGRIFGFRFNIYQSGFHRFIVGIIYFVIRLVFSIIPVLPTFIITAGYMKFFKKEETESKEIVLTADSKVSYFDGGLLSYVGWKILGFIITLFTFGICYPWSLCMVYGWKVNHTTIDGKRLKFNGKAISLFGHWILWGFLTIITLGIFSFWLSIFLKKWIVKNTSIVESNGIEKPLSTDTDNNASYFDGGLLSYVGWKILGFIINVFTLGICYPWSLCMLYGWEINHSVIDGKRQKFNGKALSLLGHWILWVFLTIITLGIFSFWLFIALEKWKVKNTTFEDSNTSNVVNQQA